MNDSKIVGLIQGISDSVAEKKVNDAIENLTIGQVDLSNYAKKNGDVNNDFSANNATVKGNIMPSANGTQDIGAPDNRFKTIYVNEAKLSTNTLYIGDTPVLGTSQDTIVIKGDIDQSVTMKTSGVGTTKVISGSGVELSTSGMNANVTIQATGSGSNANIGATNQVNLTAPSVNLNGNTSVDSLTVRGNLIVNGGTTTVNSTTVQVADNIMELNKNEVGYGVTAGRAGIKIDRGDADAQLLIFDETDDKFKIGTDTSLKSLTTQEYVDLQDAKKADKVHSHNISDITNLQANLDSKVTNTTTINGKDLNSNITLSKSDIGLGSVQNVDTTNASNITSGVLPSAQLPIATNTIIGGVKAGTNITISADGTISSSGSNNINDNLTTSTSNTYSIDKIVSLLSNKQNKLYLQNTQPSSPIINDIWINNTSSPYIMNVYNGTSFIQVGGSSNGVGITDWTSNTNYAINTSFIIYNNLLYRCNTSHTSSTSFDLTKWQYIGSTDAKSINGIVVDDSNRSNGRGLFYNQSTNKLEYADVNITGIVGSTIITPISNTNITAGSEVTFNHPNSINIIPVIEEQIAGSSVTDAHVDFSDSSKYILQDSGKLLVGNNKTQLDIYTKLLMHMDDSSFTDVCGHTVTNSGVILDSTNKVFGSGSAYFNGSSYLSIPNSSQWDFGSNNFTIDFRFMIPTLVSSQQIFIDPRNSNSWKRFVVYLSSNNCISFGITNNGTSFTVVTSSTISANTYYHVAIVRNGLNLTLYLNGINVSSTTFSGSAISDIGNLVIGRGVDSSYFKGNIDELRIINGIAKWTSNFTPPISAQFGTPFMAINTPTYLQTTGDSDYSLTTIDTITSLTIPVTTTTNSTVKCLFSVDNKQNWLYYNGTSVQKFTGDITQDWGSNGSLYTQLQTYFTNKTITSLTSDLSSVGITSITTFDLMFQLNTTNLNETPSISPITMVYTTTPHNEFASIGSYDETGVKFGVKRINNSSLAIKNLTSKSRTIKLNVITSA